LTVAAVESDPMPTHYRRQIAPTRGMALSSMVPVAIDVVSMAIDVVSVRIYPMPSPIPTRPFPGVMRIHVAVPMKAVVRRTVVAVRRFIRAAVAGARTPAVTIPCRRFLRSEEGDGAEGDECE
jgi:hypothetical protein